MTAEQVPRPALKARTIAKKVRRAVRAAPARVLRAITQQTLVLYEAGACVTPGASGKSVPGQPVNPVPAGAQRVQHLRGNGFANGIDRLYFTILTKWAL